MKMLKKVLIAGTISLASLGANAELVNVDWSSTGDELSVYDDVSGLTWLDLSVTDGMTYVEAGNVAGARYATWTELDNMVNRYFGAQLDNIGGPTVSNISLVENWMSLFGTTTPDGLQSNGYVDRENGTISDFQVYSNGSYAHIWQANDNMVGSSSAFSTFMIAEPSGPNASVPLTTSMVLMALSMIGFSSRRKSK